MGMFRLALMCQVMQGLAVGSEELTVGDAQETGRQLQSDRLPRREDLRVAVRLARLPAYGESSVQTAAENFGLRDWQRLQMWEGHAVASRAWLLKRGNLCVLTFRGTAPEASDWDRNLRTSAADFEVAPGKVCKAHSGWLEEYRELRGGISEPASACARDSAEGLLVVGHSQGAAVAHLFGLEAAHRGWVPLDKLKVVTFGEPLTTKDCEDPGLSKVRVVTAAPVQRLAGVNRPQEIDVIASLGIPGGQHMGRTLFLFAGGNAEGFPHSEGWAFGPSSSQTGSWWNSLVRSPRGYRLHSIDEVYERALDALSEDRAYFRSRDLTASEVEACRESGNGDWGAVLCFAKKLGRCGRCLEDIDCLSGSCARRLVLELCTGEDGSGVWGCPWFGRGSDVEPPTE
uniref:Fungal lipase-type domain-containing protein n=1 Tax=Chromera velia CCMP2878 TaxID=1169474 RepID=A0A0G4HJ82_9ALVE|eukprot:Cvel_28086.t1-p1 / transcript=Cvel_28086.t1 / gene=Cvel_28086 / organism=Chromera_velia_CCMP2878 / gene_product=hypothetical protein / transcript_product=hypothetical protein / location=Cvel_scaffold3612:10843-13085(+) / protein_length=399 / sequence_SO=supercontig / SO=protein_coding / is_pseudo=false